MMISIAGEFKFDGIQSPTISDGFIWAQPIVFDMPDFAAINVSAPRPADDEGRHLATLDEVDNGALFGTSAADTFRITDAYDGGWVLIGYEPGKDRIAIDHSLVPGLPHGHIDPATLYDGLVSLTYDGQTIVAFDQPGYVLGPDDIVVF